MLNSTRQQDQEAQHNTVVARTHEARGSTLRDMTFDHYSNYDVPACRILLVGQ